MDNFYSRKAKTASAAFDFASLRNWLVVVALLMGVFASTLASQPAYAAPVSAEQSSPSSTTSNQVAINFTYTKTGPASAQSGSTVTYVLTAANNSEDPFFGQIYDEFPTDLDYVSYTSNSELQECGLEDFLIFSTPNHQLAGTKAQKFSQHAHVNSDGSQYFFCEFDVAAHSTVTFNVTFKVTGSTGCFTNFSFLDLYPLVSVTSLGNKVTKPDSANSNIPFEEYESDVNTCITSENKTPADLIAQLRVNPDRTDSINPAGDISYTLVVKNIRPGQANNVQANFPFDSNLDVGYMTATDPNVWVSSVDITSTQHSVTINFPNIIENGIYTATLVMRPSATATTGAVEFNRFTVKWDDGEKPGKTVGSNGVRYSLSDQEGSTLNLTGGAVQLFNPSEVTIKNGGQATITGDFFAPDELVTVWTTAPDGTSSLIGSAHAGPNGEIVVTLSPVALTAGDKYNLSAYGNRSEVYGSSLITIGS